MKWSFILLIFGVCIFAINANNDEPYTKQESSVKLNIDLLASFSLLAGLLLRGNAKSDLNVGKEKGNKYESLLSQLLTWKRDHEIKGRLLDDQKLDSNLFKKVTDDINTVTKLIGDPGFQKVVDEVTHEH